MKDYKEYVRARLAKITPILQRAAVGDFSGEIQIPDEEDEFSELLIGLNLMMDDLRRLEETKRESEKEKGERLSELEKWRRLTTGRELRMVELKERVEALEKKLGEIENNKS